MRYVMPAGSLTHCRLPVHDEDAFREFATAWLRTCHCDSCLLAIGQEIQRRLCVEAMNPAA